MIARCHAEVWNNLSFNPLAAELSMWHPFTSVHRMGTKETDQRERKIRRWAERLAESVQAVLARHPQADPENVRHTLILLEQPPLERLRRSLTRGRSAVRRK